jgi:hypothetical protein
MLTQKTREHGTSPNTYFAVITTHLFLIDKVLVLRQCYLRDNMFIAMSLVIPMQGLVAKPHRSVLRLPRPALRASQ